MLLMICLQEDPRFITHSQLVAGLEQKNFMQLTSYQGLGSNLAQSYEHNTHKSFHALL